MTTEEELLILERLGKLERGITKVERKLTKPAFHSLKKLRAKRPIQKRTI